jgi:hypothetical protein
MTFPFWPRRWAGRENSSLPFWVGGVNKQSKLEVRDGFPTSAGNSSNTTYGP